MLKTTLKIEGMMCSMCASHINNAIRNSFPLKKITSSHTKGECIIVSENAIEEKALQAVLDKLGYTLLCFTQEPYEKKRLFHF